MRVRACVDARARARVGACIRVCICLCRRRLAAALSSHDRLGQRPRPHHKGAPSPNPTRRRGAGRACWTCKLPAPSCGYGGYRRPRGHLGGLERRRARRSNAPRSTTPSKWRLKQLSPVSICAHTDTLLNSAARAMAEITCTGITSTQPVGGDTGVLPC